MGFAFWPKKAAEKMQQERSGSDKSLSSANSDRISNANKSSYFYDKPLTESEKDTVKQFADEKNYALPQRVENIFNKVIPIPSEYGAIGHPRTFLKIAGKKPPFFKLAVAVAILLVSLQIVNHYGTIFILEDVVKELLNARTDIESIFATHDKSQEKINLHHQYVSEMDEILSFLDGSLDADETLTKYYLESGVIDKLMELLEKSEHPFILLHSLTTLEKCARFDPKCVEYLIKEKNAIEKLNDKLLKLGYEMMQEKRIPLNKLLNPIVVLLIRLYSEKNEWLNEKDRDFIAMSLQIAQPKYFHKMGIEVLQNLATQQMEIVNKATREDYENEEKRQSIEKSIISLDAQFMQNLNNLAEEAPLEEVRNELKLILESLKNSHEAYLNKTRVTNAIDVSPLHKASMKEVLYRRYQIGPKEAIGNILYLFMIPFTMGWLRYRWISAGAPVTFIRWTMFQAAQIFFLTDFVLAPITTFFFDPSKSNFARNQMIGSGSHDMVFFSSLFNKALTYGLQLKAFADTYFIAFPYLIKQYEGTQFSVIRNSVPAYTFRLYGATQLILRKKLYGQIPLQQPLVLTKIEKQEKPQNTSSGGSSCH